MEFVRVVSKREQDQGAKILGGLMAGFFALVAVYFAVVYWPVTLAVLGVVLAISLVIAFTSA